MQKLAPATERFQHFVSKFAGKLLGRPERAHRRGVEEVL